MPSRELMPGAEAIPQPSDTIRALQALAPRSRVAFAAACAERLFPAYVAFSKAAGHGDAPAVAECLERVWRYLIDDDTTGVAWVQVDLDRCMALHPGEDDEPWSDDLAYADDAVAAVAYALRALQSGDPREAAWAADRACDALDHHMTHVLGIDDEERIAAHPLLQAERLRQRRDLDELRAAGENASHAIALVRDRARADASTFFGLPHGGAR